jgi:hypothetical protein
MKSEEEGGGVFCTIGPGDYEACKAALKDLSTGTAGMNRILAAARYGGREGWAAIVYVWEDILKKSIERTGRKDFEIAHVVMFHDGTCRVFEVDSTIDEEVLPTDYEPPWQKYIEAMQREADKHD